MSNTANIADKRDLLHTVGTLVMRCMTARRNGYKEHSKAAVSAIAAFNTARDNLKHRYPAAWAEFCALWEMHDDVTGADFFK